MPPGPFLLLRDRRTAAQGIEPDAAVISTLRCGKSAERSIDSQCHRCTDQLLEFSRFD